MTVAPQPAFSCGYSCSRRLEIASISPFARARSTPDFSRAITDSLWFSRTARCSAVCASGTQIFCAATAHEASENRFGITPTMVYAVPSREIVLPTTSRAPAR
jgi:hypothetical protein